MVLEFEVPSCGAFKLEIELEKIMVLFVGLINVIIWPSTGLDGNVTVTLEVALQSTKLSVLLSVALPVSTLVLYTYAPSKKPFCVTIFPPVQ